MANLLRKRTRDDSQGAAWGGQWARRQEITTVPQALLYSVPNGSGLEGAGVYCSPLLPRTLLQGNCLWVSKVDTPPLDVPDRLVVRLQGAFCADEKLIFAGFLSGLFVSSP